MGEPSRSGQRRRALLWFLVLVLGLTVLRALWFGLSLPMVLVVLAIYVGLFSVMIWLERDAWRGR